MQTWGSKCDQISHNRMGGMAFGVTIAICVLHINSIYGLCYFLFIGLKRFWFKNLCYVSMLLLHRGSQLPWRQGRTCWYQVSEYNYWEYKYYTWIILIPNNIIHSPVFLPGIQEKANFYILSFFNLLECEDSTYPKRIEFCLHLRHFEPSNILRITNIFLSSPLSFLFNPIPT